MDWRRLEERIPEYSAFWTVDELKTRSARLAQEYPEIVSKTTIGQSRNGEAIECLQVGDGRKRAVWIGCPHPNEPIGAMTADFLAEVLARDDKLREELDCTFYIVKCIDPDGTRLNEGWFKGPFDLYTYASNFYRPAGKDQVEWTFPIEYKTLKFAAPLPETRALMHLLDQAKPHMLYSLHNAGFGGGYFYLSRPEPELYSDLHQALVGQGIPLSLGEPEVPWAKVFDQAIYELPRCVDSYDYFARFVQGDPAEMVLAGASSAEYAEKYGTLTLVCELPYFYHPAVCDTTPANVTRQEAILASVSLQRKMYEFLAPRFEAVGGCPESPFWAALSDFIGKAQKRLAAQEEWARSQEDLKRTATKAEVFDNFVISRFYAMLQYGMLARLCQWCLDKGVKVEVSQRTRTETLAALRDITMELEREYTYQVIPIRKLVAAQATSGLKLLESLPGGE